MSRIYPDHIYDPTRIQIASELVQHEFRKLFPSVPRKLWPALDGDIANWFDGERFELAAVHDFWNAADGILRGFKLKGLIRYITAENVRWEQLEIPIERIDIVWHLNPLLARFGEPPYDTRVIAKGLATDPELKAALLADSDLHSESSLPRDHYPVLLIGDNGRYKIGDGNRRVLRALLYGRPTIFAWVARMPDHKQLHNYWVSTGFLRTLGEQAKVAEETGDKETLAGLQRVVGSLFEQSVIAETNFELRVQKDYGVLWPKR
jgi:hypothetical protein